MCSAGAAALRAVLLRTVLRVRCCTRDLAASAVLLRAALLRTVLLRTVLLRTAVLLRAVPPPSRYIAPMALTPMDKTTR